VIEFFTVEQVIEIHNEMLQRYGGLKGIRDINLLHSSVLMPQTAAFGHDLCPSIYDKAAAYTFYKAFLLF
jgi:death-on-curing protein